MISLVVDILPRVIRIKEIAEALALKSLLHVDDSNNEVIKQSKTFLQLLPALLERVHRELGLISPM